MVVAFLAAPLRGALFVAVVLAAVVFVAVVLAAVVFAAVVLAAAVFVVAVLVVGVFVVEAVPDAVVPAPDLAPADVATADSLLRVALLGGAAFSAGSAFGVDFVGVVLVRAADTVAPLIPVRVVLLERLGSPGSTMTSMPWCSKVLSTFFMALRPRSASTWAWWISVPVMLPRATPLASRCCSTGCWNALGRGFADGDDGAGVDTDYGRLSWRGRTRRPARGRCQRREEGVSAPDPAWPDGVDLRFTNPWFGLSRSLGTPCAIRYVTIIKRWCS